MTAGLVAGRFHLRRLLGSGGTASVFEADDVHTGGTVALKLLHAHLAHGPEAVDAFFEEVRAAQAIVHPNLAQIYDAGVDSRDPPVVWIAMELVPGVSLADHVRERGALDLADAVVLGRTVLDALTAVHASGVVHRDVSPANIMFDPSERASVTSPEAFARGIRLLDFGLADVPGRTTLGGDALLSAMPSGAEGVVASVPYASPEQLSGAAVEEPSDLYQLGASLYLALTGHAPFGGDPAAVVRAHLSAPPPVVSARRRDAPRALDAVIATSMLKRAEDRYADATAMRRALDAVPLVAGAAPAAATSLTRVYRTTVAADDDAPQADAATVGPTIATEPFSAPSGGGWRLALVAAVLIAATTGAAGWSAMAASSRPAPTAAVGAATSPVPSAPPASTSATTVLVRVPDVSTLSLVDATRALERAGLVVGDVAREDGPGSVDTVRGTTPAAGDTVAPGTAVVVHAASGVNVVPTVAGLAPADAQGVLSAAGFSSRVEDGGTGASGMVALTVPGAGQSAPVGTLVALWVPRAEPTTPTPNPTPLPTRVTTPTPQPTPTPGSTGQGGQ